MRHMPLIFFVSLWFIYVLCGCLMSFCVASDSIKLLSCHDLQYKYLVYLCVYHTKRYECGVAQNYSESSLRQRRQYIKYIGLH